MKLLNAIFAGCAIMVFFAASCSEDDIAVTDTVIIDDDDDDDDDDLTGTDLGWSANSCTVTLGDENTYSFPSLNNPDGLEVSYSSSNEGVAVISADGNVSIAGEGATVISATLKESGSSSAYTLIVITKADDGAFNSGFSPSGSSDDDDISMTSFTRLVTVTYSGTSASVSGYGAVADLMDVSVDGAGVTITYTGTENIAYKLTGTTSNGFFKLYSQKKQAIWLSGVSITNSAGAAINNQSGKRCFVYVEGDNSLSDGSAASYSAAGNEDMKGVFFSEGQLIFSGPGSGTNRLDVTASNSKGKSCIVSDDYLRFLANAKVSVTAGNGAGHGIKANDYIRISDGELSVKTGAAMKKGVTSDDYVLIEGGTSTITVSGGVAYDSEDAEYKGSAGIKADNYFRMTGGSVSITNSGAGGKGIRAGSDTYSGTGKAGVIEDSVISGGTLTITTTGNESNDVSAKGIKIGWAVGTENRVTSHDGGLTVSGGSIKVTASRSEAIEVKDFFTMTDGELYAVSNGDDAVNCVGDMNISGGYIYANSSRNDGLDANGNLTLSGGHVFAVTTAGGAEVAIDCAERMTLTVGNGVTMVAYPGIESGASMKQSCYKMSCSAGSWNALHDGSSYTAAFKAPSGVSSVVVSAPSLKNGYKGVSVGETTYCNGVWATSSISGGTSVSLSAYSGGGGGGHGRW